MPVYLVATLDTKAAEATYLADLLVSYGVSTVIVDASCSVDGAKMLSDKHPVISPRALAVASVGVGRLLADRGAAVAQVCQCVTAFLLLEAQAGRVQGLLGIGGSAGTTIGTAAMRALPMGVPKLMVSTLASGNVRPWVQDKEIMMLNSIVDFAGVNRISRVVLGEAARAMAGMVTLPESPMTGDERPLLAATMFGVTTPCVQEARRLLELAGYELLVFHATGNGGQAMESLIDEGLIAGVLDITTTELADELVGGVLSAGPNRLTAAGRRGIPQVISVGATDMVNFGPPETVPAQFASRKFHQHNPTVTLMRTSVDENLKLGEEIGRKAAASRGPTSILLPGRGVSAIDGEELPFDDPIARQALFDGVYAAAGAVRVQQYDLHINSPDFAQLAATELLSLLSSNANVKA